VRAHFHVQEVQALAPDGVQVCWTVTMELEGADKPACVAQALVRYYV